MSHRPLAGRIALVTGASSGIGAVTAEALARQGASVVVVGRDPSRCDATVSGLRHQFGPNAAEAIVADLTVTDDLRRLADTFQTRHDRLHILVHNAGALYFDRLETAQGIERTFALNHLAPFLLTNLLLEPLRHAESARVVVVSSDAHRLADLRLDDWPRPKRFQGFPAYCRAKLASILFTRELARRLEGSGITANALHPGFVASRFFDHHQGAIGSILRRSARAFALSPEVGAQTSIYLAASPEIASASGRYFAKSREITPSRHARNDDAARRLWELSSELVASA